LVPETRLASQYGVGKDAIRDALGVLRAEGLVVTERGKPARVAPTVGATVTLAAGEHAVVVGGTLQVTRTDGSTETYPAGTRIHNG
jgi:DNA-binding FadR family transcriptional regulator